MPQKDLQDIWPFHSQRQHPFQYWNKRTVVPLIWFKISIKERVLSDDLLCSELYNQERKKLSERTGSETSVLALYISSFDNV